MPKAAILSTSIKGVRLEVQVQNYREEVKLIRHMGSTQSSVWLTTPKARALATWILNNTPSPATS
jgi:hypothetical protein